VPEGTTHKPLRFVRERGALAFVGRGFSRDFQGEKKWALERLIPYFISPTPINAIIRPVFAPSRR
jgi:hypothetical protein